MKWYREKCAQALTFVILISMHHASAQKVAVPFTPGQVANLAQVHRVDQETIPGGGEISDDKALAKASFISRALSNRFSERCNVLDYGAKNDGKTDDTVAWQAAVDACSAKGGGIVEVPSGNSIVGTLRIPSKIAIHGQGMYTSVIIPLHVNGDTFQFQPGARYDEISGLRWAYEVNTHSSGAVFHVCGTCGTIWIHNVSTEGAYRTFQIDGDGSKFGGATEVYIDEGDFRDTAKGSNMTQIDGGNDHFFFHITADNAWSIVQPNAGFAVNKTGGFWLLDSDIINFNHGLAITGSNNTAWGFVADTAFDTSHGDQVDFDAPAGTTIYGWQFTGVWLASADNGCGMHLHGEGTIDGIQFNGGRVMNNFRDGIDIEVGKNIMITDSFIVGDGAANYRSAHPNYVGVRINGKNTVDGVMIRGNRIGTAMQYPIYPGVAIKIEDQVNKTDYSDHIMITDNDLRGTIEKKGVFYNTGSRRNILIEHNWSDD